MSDLGLPALPPRPPTGHKGTFGTVCVIGGQAAAPHVMVGGPAFTAMAALRSGAGLAVLALPEPILVAGLGLVPSATGLALPVDAEGRLRPSACAEVLDAALPRVNCIAVGPGMGTGEAQRQVVLRLLGQEEIPAVVDADAINCLAQTEAVQRDLHARMVLTPHPGEFRRLAQALAIDADPESPSGRPAAAQALSRRLGCVTVLKGHGTVVSDGLEVWTSSAGGPALATAGSGDVLTGVIASFIAQFEASLSFYDCARLAVEVHGRAGELWSAASGDAGLLATDLVTLLPEVVRRSRLSGPQPA